MPDILLFGATGYTGRLTARALAKRGASFAIAGRDRGRLDALAETTGSPEVRLASVGDVDALTAALEDAKVLITCVGPFVELGETAVEAALKAGVHYIDSTGEGPFIQRLIEQHDRAARERNIAMAPALGFDEVPADSAATLATKGMERANLVLTYALPSSGSRGTIRSALGIAASRGGWIESGVRTEIRAGQKSRWSPMPSPLGPKRAISFPLAEGRLAPLHLDLQGLETYVTTDPIQSALLKVGAPALGLLTETDLGRSLTKAAIERLPEGPNDSQREKGRWTVLAEANSGKEWRNVSLTGTDVYGLTAEFLAAGALHMAAEGYQTSGVVSPVQAVGIDTWKREFEDHGVVVTTYERN